MLGFPGLLGRAGLDLDGVPDLSGEERRAERRLVGDDMLLGVAVPGSQDGVAGDRPGLVPQLDDAPDPDLVERGVLEVGDAGPREVALERWAAS